MTEVKPLRFYSGGHSPDCWTTHESCALSSAVSYLSARIAHDQARLRLYRQATDERADTEVRAEAVALARQLMLENSTRDWGKVG